MQLSPQQGSILMKLWKAQHPNLLILGPSSRPDISVGQEFEGVSDIGRKGT
jgi:hypothetical protein